MIVMLNTGNQTQFITKKVFDRQFDGISKLN